MNEKRGIKLRVTYKQFEQLLQIEGGTITGANPGEGNYIDLKISVPSRRKTLVIKW